PPRREDKAQQEVDARQRSQRQAKDKSVRLVGTRRWQTVQTVTTVLQQTAVERTRQVNLRTIDTKRRICQRPRYQSAQSVRWVAGQRIANGSIRDNRPSTDGDIGARVW